MHLGVRNLSLILRQIVYYLRMCPPFYLFALCVWPLRLGVSYDDRAPSPAVSYVHRLQVNVFRPFVHLQSKQITIVVSTILGFLLGLLRHHPLGSVGMTETCHREPSPVVEALRRYCTPLWRLVPGTCGLPRSGSTVNSGSESGVLVNTRPSNRRQDSGCGSVSVVARRRSEGKEETPSSGRRVDGLPLSV